MDPKIVGLIRHILTAAGVILVALGILTEDVFGQISEAIMTIVGALTTLISIIMSWTAPEKKPTANNL